MQQYQYFLKEDPNKETIMSWCASSQNNAVSFFASLKKLPEKEFNNLYEVQKVVK